MERGFPSNPHAERVVLGSCLSQSNDKGAVADALMKLEADDFTVASHRAIFNCFKTLLQKGVPLDYVIVSEWFRARGALDDVGGLSGIVALDADLPQILNLGSYVDILKKAAGLRRIIYLSKEAMERAFLEDGSPTDIASSYAKSIGQIANEHEENGAQSIAEFVDSYKGGVDALMTPHLTQPGIMLGFPRFDELTDGLHEDEIFIFGAPPAMGKTAFGVQLMRNIADRGVPVAIFSMEMSKRSLFYRMICDEAQVPFQRFRRGEYNADEAERLRDAAKLIYALPIYIDERSGLSPSDFSLRLSALKDKYGVEAWLMDFIQLMAADNKRLTGVEKMTNICLGVQSAVKKIHTPGIILSQLTRDPAKSKRQPEMTDLRESGSLEQIADLVGMIWRQEMIDREKASLKGQAVLHIRKGRNIQTKSIGMRFIGWRMHFEELTEEEEDAQA
jgi:replicative DNA helicase